MAAPEAVGVGIVGQRDVRPAPTGHVEQQVHRARLLRVRERHRRERAVGNVLLGHHDGRVEPRRLERLLEHRAAHPVHGRVGHHTAPYLGPQADGGDGVDVGVDPRRVEIGDVRIVLRGEDDRQRIEPVDALGDLAIHRVDDLRAGGEEHLVAVVGRRVVRGRDDHAGGGLDAGDRPGQHRRRLDARVEHGADAHRGEHPRRVEREQIALATSVVRDHDAAPRGVRDRPGLLAVEQPSPEPRRGLADHQPVHPHRTGADGGAEAGGAELQPAGEPVGEFGGGQLIDRRLIDRRLIDRSSRVGIGRGPLDQIGQFHRDVGIGLDCQPAVGGFEDRLVRIAVVVSHRGRAYATPPAAGDRRG